MFNFKKKKHMAIISSAFLFTIQIQDILINLLTKRIKQQQRLQTYRCEFMLDQVKNRSEQTIKQIGTLENQSKQLQQQSYNIHNIFNGLKKTNSIQMNDYFGDRYVQQQINNSNKANERKLKSRSNSSNDLVSQDQILNINQEVKRVTEKVQNLKMQMNQKLKPKQKIQLTSLKPIKINKKFKSTKQKKLQQRIIDIIYQHYCRNQFNQRKITFDKIKTQIHTMNITTFMHFCRDFQLTNKQMIQRLTLLKQFKMSSQNFKQINREQFASVLSKIAQRCFAKGLIDWHMTKNKHQQNSSANDFSRISQSLQQFQKQINMPEQQRKQVQEISLKDRSKQMLYHYLQIDTLQKFEQKAKKLGIKYYPHEIQAIIQRTDKNIIAKPRIYSRSRSKSSDQQSLKQQTQQSPKPNLNRKNNKYFSESKLQKLNIELKSNQKRNQQSPIKKSFKQKVSAQRKTPASLSTSRPMQIRAPVFQLGYSNLYKLRKGQKIELDSQRRQKRDPLFQELSGFRLNKVVEAAKKTLEKQNQGFKQSMIIIKNSELNTKQQMKELLKLNPELKMDALKSFKWDKLQIPHSIDKANNKKKDYRIKTEIDQQLKVENPLSHLFCKQDQNQLNLSKLGIQQEIEDDLFLIQHLKNERKKQFEQRKTKHKQLQKEEQKLAKHRQIN